MMKNFQIYKHPFYGFECVKIGFSWPALFFGPIWIFISRLWAVFFIWITLYGLILYVSGMPHANLSVPLVLIAISIALLITPAFQGNDWLMSSLRKRGYVYVNIVQASSKEEALAVANNAIHTTAEEFTAPANPGVDNFFAKDTSVISFEAIFGLILMTIGLIASLILTKPNDQDFLKYFLSDNRMQSEIANQVDPSNTMSAIAFLGDMFDFVASGNLKHLNAEVRKKDYRLFVLYSIESDIQSYRGKLEKLKLFSGVDASRALGLNSTYVGLWGNFYRIGNRPLAAGEIVDLFRPEQSKVAEENQLQNINIPDVSAFDNKQSDSSFYIPDSKTDVILTFDQALSIIEALPLIQETSKRIIEDSNGQAHPRFYPAHDDYGYELHKGKKYNAINFIEDHEDHMMTLYRFLISLDGKEILIWDMDSNEFNKIDSEKIDS